MSFLLFLYLCSINYLFSMEKGDITSLSRPDFIREIKQVIAQARQKVYTVINSAMDEAYRQMDRRTVEQEQQDKDRADYGSQLLSSILPDLSRNIRCTVANFNLIALQTFNEMMRTSPATPYCTTTTGCSPRNICSICLRRRNCGKRSSGKRRSSACNTIIPPKRRYSHAL